MSVAAPDSAVSAQQARIELADVFARYAVSPDQPDSDTIPK